MELKNKTDKAKNLISLLSPTPLCPGLVSGMC